VAGDEDDEPYEDGNAEKEPGDLNPLGNVEQESKDVRNGVGQRRRGNESGERVRRPR